MHCYTMFLFCLYLQVIFKKLYKSAREQGTLRFFREKLQRRNVTIDVKHYEDCEQLFLTIGKCFTVEALVQVFLHGNEKWPHQKKQANLDVGDNKRKYYDSVLDKFIDQFLITPPTNDGEESSPDCQDFVRNYSLCLLKYYFLFLDFKDTVKEGNGERTATLHKQLLSHFTALPGFNNYAIEMLISIVQNNIFLSEAETHQSIWASTVNWKGDAGNNIEIDLLQKNRNKSIKKSIKSMGPSKTDNAIDKSSRASGGEDKIGENFDVQRQKVTHSTSHSHRSTAADESIVMVDLRVAKPFTSVHNRRHDSFLDIQPDPLASLDQTELDKWLARQKKNLFLDAPLGLDEEDS